MSCALLLFSDAAAMEPPRSRRLDGLGGFFFLVEYVLLDLTALAATRLGARFFPSTLWSAKAASAAAAAAAAAFGASFRFRLARRSSGISGEDFIVTKADAMILSESILSFKSTQEVTCSCISSHDVWVVKNSC